MSDVQDHPEYRGLLAVVKAAPDDDLPRLVLADWLEEHGSPDWAEFIRAQCLLDRFPHAARIRADTFTDAEGVLPDWQPPLTAARRVRELWPTVAKEVFDGELNRGQTATVTCDVRCLFVYSRAQRLFPQFEARRGFVERVDCLTAHWIGGGDTSRVGQLAVARQPVREVRLIDQTAGETSHSWFAIVDEDRPGPNVLPWCIARHLTGHISTNREWVMEAEWRTWYYPSSEAANTALSRAAIAWAEAEAGV